MGYDLATLSIDHVELTDRYGGETLTRFPLEAGDVVVGDRGYAPRRGMYTTVRSGADYLIRLNWQNGPLEQPNGEPFELLQALRGLPDADARDFAVRVKASAKDKIPAATARLVASSTPRMCWTSIASAGR